MPTSGAARPSKWLGRTPNDSVRPIESVTEVWRRTFDLKGRSRRPEFWWWMVFVLAIETATLLFMRASVRLAGHAGLVIFGAVTALLLAPTVSVQVRRLHDRDLSGWTLAGPLALQAALPFSSGGGLTAVLSVLSIVASGWIIVQFCSPGTPTSNRFGPPQSRLPRVLQVRLMREAREFASKKEEIDRAVEAVATEYGVSLQDASLMVSLDITLQDGRYRYAQRTFPTLDEAMKFAHSVKRYGPA